MAFTPRQAPWVAALSGAVVAGILFVAAAYALTSLGVPITPNDDGTNLFRPTTTTRAVWDKSSWPPVTITTLPGLESPSSSSPAASALSASSSAGTVPAMVATIPTTTAPAPSVPLDDPIPSVVPTITLPPTTLPVTTTELSTTLPETTLPVTTTELPTTLPETSTSLEPPTSITLE